MQALEAMLAQVLSEEIEYQPGYFVWHMEADIRDWIVRLVRERLSELADTSS